MEVLGKHDKDNRNYSNKHITVLHGMQKYVNVMHSGAEWWSLWTSFYSSIKCGQQSI